MSYRSTSLWKNSIGITFEDEEKNGAAEKLRVAYESLRSRAAELTSRVAADFPSLTVHDASHLDALWQIASIISGDTYPMSPLEGFVLGASFLLHDAALTFEAYEGGKDGLRNTDTWRDAFASAQRQDLAATQAELQDRADFSAIRILHAHQAGELLDHAWLNGKTGTSIQLLDDLQLRTRLGRTIGEIASSHHWSIEDVASKLPSQVPSPSGFPSEWRIDPVKLACILRCADAAHLDDRRAPDFLFALLKRSGVSADHWLFQNWLNPIDVDVADMSRSTLLFTSTRPFPAEFADAWWLAYDAISLLDKEITSSNALLEQRPQRNTGSPALLARHVKGSDSPPELARFVTTEGWQPRSASLHVGNVRRLVETLGGNQLYGVGPERALIVIRELLQNSRDAIIARRTRDSGYMGRILVRSKHDKDSVTVEIDDDGVGMSERVLTGPLLDFGQSFWTSELVKDELPGLLSSEFRSVGRYGVGFFFRIHDRTLGDGLVPQIHLWARRRY